MGESDSRDANLRTRSLAASLDNESDELVQKVIREEFSGCTNLTVAHRLGEQSGLRGARSSADTLSSSQTRSSTLIASWFYALVASPSLTNLWCSWTGKTAHSGIWWKRPDASTSCMNVPKRRALEVREVKSRTEPRRRSRTFVIFFVHCRSDTAHSPNGFVRTRASLLATTVQQTQQLARIAPRLRPTRLSSRWHHRNRWRHLWQAVVRRWSCWIRLRLYRMIRGIGRLNLRRY